MPDTSIPVDAEVVPPAAGGAAAQVYPQARTMIGRVLVSPQAAWFAWGVIVGAVLVGTFVWKTKNGKD